MPYTIKSKYERGDNANNSTAIIVDDAVINNNSPIDLVGNFYPNYAPKIAESFLDIMENFNDDEEPRSPRQGMLWHKRDNTDMRYTDMRYYDGMNWISFNTSANSYSTLFPRPDTADGIDLRTLLSIANSRLIFKHPGEVGDTTEYHATSLLLKVTDFGSSGNDATIRLHKTTTPDTNDIPNNVTAGDILGRTNVNASSANQHINFIIQGVTETIRQGEGIKMEIEAESTGDGVFTVDAYLFGYIS